VARIRTIKPEFPHSESIGRLSRDARLMFIQLWTIADDHGRARAAPQLLCGQLYPYDADAPKLIGKWLAELEHEGHIRLYEVDDSRYLEISGWSKHQRVDNAGKSNIPEPRGEPEPPRREPPRAAASDGEPPLDLGPRRGEDLGVDLGPSRAVADATRTIPRPEDFEKFWGEYPKREGANPKKPAAIKFFTKVRQGANPEAIITGARLYAADVLRLSTEPRFVAQAVTWLHQERWQDFTEAPVVAVNGEARPIGWSPGMPTDEELRRQREADDGERPDQRH
jgi:hypothetical protein